MDSYYFGKLDLPTLPKYLGYNKAELCSIKFFPDNDRYRNSQQFPWWYP